VTEFGDAHGRPAVEVPRTSEHAMRAVLMSLPLVPALPGNATSARLCLAERRWDKKTITEKP